MKQILIYFTAIVLTTSCHGNLIKPTYNKGGYTFNKFYNKSLYNNESAIIYGHLRELGSSKVVLSARLNMACASLLVDSTGYYQFNGKVGDEVTFLTCISLGLRTIETEPFKVQRGDSINVNFFLAQDDRPLVNCEGNIIKQ